MTSGLTITMTMEVPSSPSSSSSQSVTCGSPDGTSGVGVCTLTAAPSFFSTGADVAATVSVVVKYGASTVAVSNTATMVLAKEPTFAALTAAGMTATLPHHPQIAGDVITVGVTATQTGRR